jgi:hypothetical protein
VDLSEEVYMCRPDNVKGTLRFESLGSYELLAATGKDSHNREGRLTIKEKISYSLPF